MHSIELELNLKPAVMPALSVRQPWAWLIAEGYKPIENRTWGTRYRGRLLIHASSGMSRDEYYAAVAQVRRFDPALAESIPHLGKLPRGCLVCRCTLADVIAPSEVLEPLFRDGIVTELELEHWYEGDYGFVLRDIERLEPVLPYRGARRLFGVDRAALEVSS